MGQYHLKSCQISKYLNELRASLVTQTVKSWPAKQEMQVWSLGWKDLLEKGWQTEGENVEVVTDFLLWSSKITAYGDCNHEIRWLHLGKKAMRNLDSVLKSKDVTLSTKVRIVKAMVFPVVLYRCESWTIKKPEHQSIDAFELWCEEDSWETLGLNFDHLFWVTDSLEKILILGNIEGRRRKGWQRMTCLDGITDSMTWTWENSGR